MAQFMNDRDTFVADAVDGVVRAWPGVARLDGFPHTRVVVRAQRDEGHVAVISGGGSGHEPAHAGFVGEGMLDAAVCGDIFASPSVDAVLAGILAVTGEPGCLLIIKNYTGDRLNFGLAAERARARGLRVETVIVADDIALPDLDQPRGLAGTLFVHKIAGAMAAEGCGLDEIAETAREVAGAARSFSISLDTARMPGSGREERMSDDEAELGLGIHGEPGIETITFPGADEAMGILSERLAEHVEDGPLVALVNNMGGANGLEVHVATRALLRGMLGDRIKKLVGPAPLMTSLDMQGVSVSLLPARDAWVRLLNAPAAPRPWPGMVTPSEPDLRPVPEGVKTERPEPSQDADVRALIERACDVMEEAREDLDALDAKSGDGDTGATVAGAARTIRDALDALPLAHEARLYRSLSDRLSEAMGGSSGVLLAIFFGAAAEAASDGADTVEALRAGLARMMEMGGAERGQRTMVDALAPALDALSDGMEAAAKAAREGADATRSMTENAMGRASYATSETLEGHADPGAEAVARLFEGLAERG